ncbi:MAG: AMIN domain-containing protein, partial [Kordiimonas sp.]
MFGVKRSLAFICLLTFASVSSAFAQDVSISGLRFGQNGDTTRFVLDLSSGVKPRIFLLSNPSRVVVDLPEVKWAVQSEAKALGAVAGYRHGLFSADTYRIVLDLKREAVVTKAFPLAARSGYSDRYVIDLKDAESAEFTSAVAASRVERSRSAPPPVPIQTNRTARPDNKRVIVV